MDDDDDFSDYDVEREDEHERDSDLWRLAFSWDFDALQEFVDYANTISTDVVAVPDWLSVHPGTINLSTMAADMLSYLAEDPGELFGSALLTFDDVREYGNAIGRLSEIEGDPFVQMAMQHLPQSARIAKLALVVRGTPEPLNRSSSRRFQQVFA